MEIMKNLYSQINAYLSKKENVESLKKSGLYTEYKRVQLAVKYIIDKNITRADDGELILRWLNTAEKTHRSYDTDKRLLMTMETMVLSNLKSEIDIQKAAMKDPSNKKSAEKKIREMTSVAGEILPDYLTHAYAQIKAMNDTVKIRNIEGKELYDLDRFFEGVRKSTRKSYVIDNLPTFDREVEEKCREVIKENAAGFIEIFEDVARTAAKADLDRIHSPKEKRHVSSKVRKYRRSLRPLDINGDELPSYLDYITDNGELLSFAEFQNTPSYKVNKEFKTEQEYNSYVSSSAFARYISYLEQPLTPEAEDNGTPSFKYPDTGRNYPKEKIILPKKQYKLTRNIENETVDITKIRNERNLETLKKIVAGALSVTLLVNALGWPVREVVKSIKSDAQVEPQPQPQPDYNPDNSQGGDQTTDTTPVDPPVPPVTEDKPVYVGPNVTVYDDEDKIKDNPVHSDPMFDNPVSGVPDNVGTDGTIIPNLPPVEETTGSQESTSEPEEPVQTTDPEQGTTGEQGTEKEPEETKEPEGTENNPEYDNPYGDVPEENPNNKTDNPDNELF